MENLAILLILLPGEAQNLRFNLAGHRRKFRGSDFPEDFRAFLEEK